jgi:predicted peptidase
MKLLRTCLLFLIVITVNFNPVHAQELDAFKKEIFVTGSDTLPYRILFPENYDRKKKYPLVIFLHGAGERGDDNEKQLTHGASLFLKPDVRKNYPAIVVFPQCPSESYWSSVQINRTSLPLSLAFDYSQPATWPLTSVAALISQLTKKESVAKSRIYIAGLSMGGMGTFEAVYRYPEVFAAAIPICGGGDTARYDNRVKKIPFWVFHGDKDAVVEVRHSRAMVNRLKNLKATVNYTEYPGVNHNSWDSAFAEPQFFPWMFSHKR